MQKLMLTTEAGFANPSGAPGFNSSFQQGSWYSIFRFICIVCRSLLSFCHFLWTIVLSVLLRFTNCDYLFGIFKLFVMTIQLKIAVKTMNVCKILLSLGRPLVEQDLRTHSEHFILRHVFVAVFLLLNLQFFSAVLCRSLSVFFHLLWFVCMFGH